MKVLIACEYSGVVRDAFIRHGHDAISCDLLPSESDFGPHIQGDVLPLLKQEWDMMICLPRPALTWQYRARDGLCTSAKSNAKHWHS